MHIQYVTTTLTPTPRRASLRGVVGVGVGVGVATPRAARSRVDRRDVDRRDVAMIDASVSAIDADATPTRRAGARKTQTRLTGSSASAAAMMLMTVTTMTMGVGGAARAVSTGAMVDDDPFARNEGASRVLDRVAKTAPAAGADREAKAENAAEEGAVLTAPSILVDDVDALGSTPTPTPMPTVPTLTPTPTAGPTASTPRATESSTTVDTKVLLNNQRVRTYNNAPMDFPAFIREGYDVKVIHGNDYVVREDGLIVKDYLPGSGETPRDNQECTFNYVAYNESGGTIDSTYRRGVPATSRLGIKGMIPGFELGLKDMRPGGKRRIIVPPELGPPVGPATFFSSKQWEVFDIELLEVKSCARSSFGMVSNVVCE